MSDSVAGAGGEGNNGVDDSELIDEEASYKAPAEKPLTEILSTDADDESLQKYKESLLKQAATDKPVVVDENDSRKVIPKTLALVIDGRPDVHIDLTSDLTEIKKKSFTIKEGCKYRLRVDFYVQRDIVTGLKYKMVTAKMGLKDKDTYMVGSYAPSTDLHSYTTPSEDAPSGMMARGKYTVKSGFIDDDKNEYLKWEWQFEIKKEWDS